MRSAGGRTNSIARASFHGGTEIYVGGQQPRRLLPGKIILTLIENELTLTSSCLTITPQNYIGVGNNWVIPFSLGADPFGL